MELTKRQTELLTKMVQHTIDDFESILFLDKLSQRTILPDRLRDSGERDLMELQDLMTKLKEVAST